MKLLTVVAEAGGHDAPLGEVALETVVSHAELDQRRRQFVHAVRAWGKHRTML